jgi:CBS domain containing-hemolysin-like protein
VLGRIVSIVVLLLLNGFFVAVEFSLVRSRKTRLEAMARNGDRFARIALRGIANMGRMLSASQLGITLSSLGLGALTEETLADIFSEWLHQLPVTLEMGLRVGLGSALAVLFVTYFHVVFGELAPRSVALTHPEKVARVLTPLLVVFEAIMRPFTTVLNKSAETVLRVFGQKPMDIEEGVHSPDELRMLVEQSEESGALEASSAGLIEGVFEFSEKNAREVMTPRTDIDALSLDDSLDDALNLVEETRRSRYPVYEENIDNIVGLVLAKDLIPVLRRSPAGAIDPDFSLRSIMRPIHVVPGSREVEEVLADFKRKKEHLAIVLDEYGGTAGLVTMEDLLEEIVGEILDEKDEPIETESRESPDLVLVPGATNIADLNERFGLNVPDDDYTTAGGYVFGVLGRLPVVGDRITAGGAVFTVREMEGRRIETLAVDLHSAGDRREQRRTEA